MQWYLILILVWAVVSALFLLLWWGWWAYVREADERDRLRDRQETDSRVDPPDIRD